MSSHLDDTYVVGVDFGTLSGRALVVRVADGQEVGTAVHQYRHALMDEHLVASGEPLPPDTEPEPPLPPDEPGEKRIKYVVGGEVTVYVVAERVQYYGPDGKLITESLKDYTRKAIRKEYASVDDFLRRWTSAERKKAVIEELESRGVLLDALAEEVGKKQGKAFDPFDLICHVAFDRPPLSRKERVEEVRKRDVFAKYGNQARAVLNALLDKYADNGIESIEDIKILTLDPFSRLGTAPELIQSFGGKPAYLSAIRELETQLYG